MFDQINLWLVLIHFFVVVTAAFQNHFGASSTANSSILTANDLASFNIFLDLLQSTPVLLIDPNTAHLNGKCLRDCQTVAKSVQNLEMWALQMIDASGKLNSGLLNGNIHFYGHFEQCLNVRQLKRNEGERSRFPVTGKYCRAEVFLDYPPRLKDIFHEVFAHEDLMSSYESELHFLPFFNAFDLGLCIPASCNHLDLTTMINSILKPINSTDLTVRVRVQSYACDVKRPLNMFGTPQKAITTLVVLVLLGLNLFGTYMDWKETKDPNAEKTPSNPLTAFSMTKNFHDFIDTSTPTRLDFVNGIRTVFSFLILFTHLNFYGLLKPIANKTEIVTLMESRWSMIFRNTVNAVDPFVFMSGFFTAYFAFGKLKNGRGLNVGRMMFVRYMKFAPLYLLIITFQKYVFPDVTGPFGLQTLRFFGGTCGKNSWWTYLLLIDNFSGLNNMCYPPAHQLMSDMQMYWMSPIIFWIMWKLNKYNRSLALAFIGGLVVAVMIAIAGIGYAWQLKPFIFHGMNLDEILPSADRYYINPFMRLGPYLLGIALAFYFQTTPVTSKLTTVRKTIGWTFAAMSIYYCYYAQSDVATPDYVYDPGQSAIYAALQLVVWNGALSWIFYVCYYNDHPRFARFLSWKGFTIFARLSYAFYMMHIMVVYVGSTIFVRGTGFVGPESVLVSLWLDVILYTAFCFVVTLTVVMPVPKFVDSMLGVLKVYLGFSGDRRKLKEG